MIRIDLLPTEEKKRKPALAPKARAPRAARAPVRIRIPVGADTAMVVVIFVVILGLLYFLFAAQKREIARLEDEIASMQAELKRLREAVRLVKDLEEKEQAIRVKLEVIGKLNKDRFLIAHMLDELSRLLPENCWIISVVEKRPSVSIEGLSFSNFVVANFMKKLETSEYFQNVDLSVVSKSKVGGYDLMKFKLTANLVSPRPSKVAGGTTGKG